MRLNFVTPPSTPNSLPRALEDEIKKLQSYKTKEEVLKQAYDVLTEKYRGYRLKTLLRIGDLFDTDVTRLWSKRGFLHCTHMNYLMKILLVGSFRFKEEDIRFKWTAIHFYSPHQYLQVNIGDHWVNVDIWGKVYGVAFGDYAHGFHAGTTIAHLAKC